MGKGFIKKSVIACSQWCSTKYFLFESGAHQGDPISPFLFVLALEILFHLIKIKIWN